MTGARGPLSELSLSSRNVRALLLLAVIFGACLCFRSRARPVGLRDGLPVFPSRLAAAEEKIDPNSAGAASLRRLPGIGPTIAQRIVDYRKSRGPTAFQTAEDLMKIRRIGPATVRKIAGELKFGPPPGEGPATRTAP